MPKSSKGNAHTHAVGKWGKETALRLLKTPGSGFNNVTLHDGYVLALTNGPKYLFQNSCKRPVKDDGTLNPEFNVYPDEVIGAAHAIGAIPAWLTIPIDRKQGTFSAFWGKITDMPPGKKGRYATAVPMRNTAGYKRLAKDEPDA